MQYKMCSHCKPTYDHVFRHSVDSCPFKTSLYCSTCACYGHNRKTCPDPPSSLFTKPCFIEQLIPHSLLVEHGIATKTLLPCVQVTPEKPILELSDDDAVLKAFLYRKGQLQSRSIKPAALRELIRTYAKTVGMELSLV